jgi:hypothetical protein
MKVKAVYNFIGKTTSKPPSKERSSIAQKTHFKNRYFERTGIRCIEPIYQDIMERLKSGRLKSKGSRGYRRSFELGLEGHNYTIIYDPKTSTLVTIF